MRARARSMLVVGLLGGGLLVALPAEGATASPPDCEDVRVLAESFRPSEALALAAEVGATTTPSQDPGSAGATEPQPCAAALGDAKARAQKATDALRSAQGKDAAAARIKASNPDEAARLREEADAKYAEALSIDVGLQEAIEGLAPEGASASSKLDAAGQLLEFGYPTEARALAMEAVKNGEVTAAEVKDPRLKPPVPSLGERLANWWTDTGRLRLEVGAWVTAAVLIGLLVVYVCSRPRDYELQPAAVTSGGANLEGVATDWSSAVPRALGSLAVDTPAARYLAAPDVALALPAIDAIPGGFKAVVEFWTWFRRLRRRVVATTLEVVGGTPTAYMALQTRSGRSLETTTLRTVRYDTDPLDAPQVSQAFIALANEAAAWIAFEFTAAEERSSIFGSTSPDAVVHLAGAVAAETGTSSSAKRAELTASRVADTEMLEARLNLAVLDITTPGSAPFTLDPNASEEGRDALLGLCVVTEAKIANLGDGPLGEVKQRDRVRLRAILLRARFNLVIADLNRLDRPLAGDDVGECHTLLRRVRIDADRLIADAARRKDAVAAINAHTAVPAAVVAAAGAAVVNAAAAAADLAADSAAAAAAKGAGRAEFAGVISTAQRIRKHAWLLTVGHVLPWPDGTAFATRLSAVLEASMGVLAGTGPTWPDPTPPASPIPEERLGAFPAWFDYSIACIAAERNSLADMTTWLDRAIAKDAPRYLRAARKDPYFFGKGLDLPDPDAVPGAASTTWLARIRALFNAEGQSS